MRRLLLCLVAMLLLALPTAAQSDPALLQAFAEKRQAMLRNGRLDLSEMSKLIRENVAEGERLVDGNPQAALDKLAELQRFGPLIDLPSVDVNMLASFAYMKLGNQEAAATHRARAEAIKAPAQPGEVFFVVAQGAGARPRLFDPLPLAQMRPELQALVQLAREKRARLLDDPGPSYLELMGAVDDALKKASAAASGGNTAEALAQLKSVERLRPIEDIPTPDLISVYSALTGQTGDTAKQQQLRELLFGINQAIAHSGDGLSAETAIKVIFVREEYAWMRDRGLASAGQRVLNLPDGRALDVLTGKDPTGNQRDYFFEVTGIFKLYGRDFKR